MGAIAQFCQHFPPGTRHAAVAAVCLLLLPGRVSAGPLPDFPAVAAVVRSHLASLPDFQTNDLLARSDVEGVWDKLAAAGWQVADRREIVQDVLPDSHLLVAQFRTRQGKVLMRKIASKPLVYDRLDRVSEVAGGPQLIRQLPRLPDGELAIGHLEDLLPKIGSPDKRAVKDFDKPTGKIYTAAQLLDRLQTSRQKAKQKSR